MGGRGDHNFPAFSAIFQTMPTNFVRDLDTENYMKKTKQKSYNKLLVSLLRSGCVREKYVPFFNKNVALSSLGLYENLRKITARTHLKLGYEIINVYWQ